MKHQYRLYGWKMSYFAGKIRAYLNYKQIDYQEKNCNAYDMKVRLPKHIGASAMPAIETHLGEWLSDTPEMITELEKRHLKNPIMPRSPRQAVAAMLLENWFDDSWLKIAIHTRWSYPENFDTMLKQESGKSLLPFAPGFIREPIAEKLFAGRIRSYMPSQGIRPDQIELLERWSVGMLDILEQHFSEHNYLLGAKPSLADYALVGAFYGHLNRDPWPRREWLAPRPHLQRWVVRTHGGDQTQSDYIADDKIPETLLPLVAIVAKEFFPMMAMTTKSVRAYIEQHQVTSGSALPRVMEGLTYPMADGEYTSSTFTYTLWRMQRIQRFIKAMPASDQCSVEQWLSEMGLPDILATDFGPELERDALGTRLK